MELANGRYKAKARQWALGETGSGNPQVAVLFDLLDEGVTGSITWYGFFSDKTFEHTMKGLRACGWQGSDLAELESPEAGVNTNEVSLVVENKVKEIVDPETNETRQVTYPEVRWVNNLGGGNLSLKAPMQSDKVKAFAESMKARILAMDLGKPPAPGAVKQPSRPVSKPASSPPPGHPAAAPSEEDLPF